MIDLHAHILPGIDDGPASEDAAVEMARAAVRAGTRAIAATPHIDSGFGVDPARLAAARHALAERLAAEGIALELLQGGEVAAAHLPDLDDGALALLTLGGGPAVLLECPFTPVGGGMEAMVADLRRRGFGVLLAHPERSPTFARAPGRLARLVELGASAQVTAGSFAGAFGETVRRAAARMLEAGLVHVIASDAHDAAKRPPDVRLGAAWLRERYGDVDRQLAWMTESAPAALVAGERPPERPPLPRRRVRLGRLRSAWSGR
jgi:protein-tyrosine phosphatase